MPGTRAAEQHQRRRRDAELLEIRTLHRWIRVEVRWVPSRKGQKQGPATSHQLEPVDDENVSKKARVARNVLHIRGEDSVKFDEAWPNADLATRASNEGALIDGLPADKVKAGDEREIQ